MIAISHIRGCISPGLHLLADCVRVGITKLLQLENSFKCDPRMRPSFTEFEGSSRWIHHGPVRTQKCIVAQPFLWKGADQRAEIVNDAAGPLPEPRPSHLIALGSGFPNP